MVQMSKELKMEELFDSYLEIYKKIGCVPIILEKFEKELRKKIIATVCDMDIQKNNIPFILVIPTVYIGLYTHVYFMKKKRKRGVTRLDPNLVIDFRKAPTQLYAIYDIKVGNDNIAEYPIVSHKRNREQNRFGLTATEGVALFIQKNEKSIDCDFCCTGSYYQDERHFTCIAIDNNGNPCLDWCFYKSTYDNLGICSYGHRD